MTISPSLGTISGGILITIVGSNLLAPAESPSCRFGSKTVSATIGSNMSEVPPLVWYECTSPSMTVGQVVDVEISQGNEQYTSDGLKFEFYEQIGLQQAELTATINLINLPIGSWDIPLRESFLLAIDRGLTGVPPSNIKILSISSTPTLSELRRLLGSIGTSYVRISISPVVGLSSLSIQNNLKTYIPASDGSGFLKNFQNYGISAGKISLFTNPDAPVGSTVDNVTMDPYIGALNPFGPYKGGSHVTVVGAGFFNTSTIRCKFECGINATRVAVGHYLTPDKLVCITPECNDATKTPCNVTVSMNGFDYLSKGFSFDYYKQPVITAVKPSLGSLEKGTVVTVSGLNFNQTASIKNANYWRCGFGSPGQSPLFSYGIVSGTLFVNGSETYVVCTAPFNFSDSPISTKILVSPNAQQYTAAGPSFQYFKTPIEITSMEPKLGPTILPTSVTFFGSHFVSSQEITCRWGYYSDGWALKPRLKSGIYVPSVPATFFTSYIPESIVCASWAESETDVDSSSMLKDGEQVEVSVSLNSEDWSTNNMTFTYYDVKTLALDSITPDRFDSTPYTEPDMLNPWGPTTAGKTLVTIVGGPILCFLYLSQLFISFFMFFVRSWLRIWIKNPR